MDSGKVLVGLAAGIAVGTLIGVLYAPEKGSETRRKISQSEHDTVEGIKHAFNDLLKMVTEKLETAKEDAGKEYGKIKGEAQHAYERGKDHLKENGRELKKEIKAEV